MWGMDRGDPTGPSSLQQLFLRARRQTARRTWKYHSFHQGSAGWGGGNKRQEQR